MRDFEAPAVFDGLDDANRVVSGFEFARTMAHERLYGHRMEREIELVAIRVNSSVRKALPGTR